EAFLVPGCRVQAGATTFLVELIQAELPVLDHPDAEFHGLIGRSRAMSELFAYLRTLSPTTLAAVICGETGSGKELVARALHTAGPRSKGPFVVFDCGAVDPSLTSATLFGHAAGAFTGAVGTRKGAFVSAHQGTLFLDEIGELPLELQPRLLRALERREVQPLGSDSWVPADVRVVCATHRDLESMVKAGKFRQDLLYRLAGITLVIPPLRERRDDIALLAGHFLRQSRPELTLEPEALEALGRHDWPGNVRELRNVIERAAALATGPALGASDIVLTPIRPGGEPAPPAVAVTPDASLERVELEAIRRALRESRGNKSEAARVLGIARKTLREKMKRYGLSDGESD
ncbi:MAG: sigma-54-dependent Fis family transcriptional regulator, partial [Candidatus Riflebacteria bacterium]|nr:sigma-54-dependent Fis family transcriptional regulator [Candidatus Riflebacteria bacterium]